MIAGSYGFLANYLPEAAAKAIFGGGDALVAGTPAPTGQADRIPVVTMSWVTGHSEGLAQPEVAATTPTGWSSAAECLAEDPSRRREAHPRCDCSSWPARGCLIVDSWFTAGSRGTGSHDFEIAHARVAEDFSFPLWPSFRALKSEQPPGILNPSFFAIAPLIIAAVSLGIARDAIDSFRRLAQTKVPRRGTVTPSQQHTMHQRVAQAEARLRSSKAYS